MHRFNTRNWNYATYVIILISFLLYWQTTSFGFVWDDMGVHLGDNPYLRKLTFSNLLHFWQEPYKGMYIPLTYMLWALIKVIGQLYDYQQPFNPALYHFMNIILHTINGVLVFKLVRKTNKSYWASFLASLFFVVHPLQVEAVAWVSETRALLSTCLGLLAILSHFRRRESSRDDPTVTRKYRDYSWFFFLLAILSKPSAVVFPGLIFILDRYHFTKSWKESTYSILPYIAFAIPIALITMNSQAPKVSYPFLIRPLIWMDTINFYLCKLIYPIHLVASYGRHFNDIITPFWASLLLGFPVLVGYLIWRIRKKARYLWISFLWILIGYLPVSGLFAFIFQDFSDVADRFFYIPMIGVSLGFATVLSATNRRETYLIASLLIIILGLRSALFQVPIWKSSINLWEHTWQYSTPQAVIYHNRGAAYLNRNEYYRAIHDFTVAIDLDSLSADSYNNRGKAFTDLGLIDLAENDYNNAIRINPRYGLAYYNRAIINNKKKRIALAYRDCLKAVELDSLDPEAWNLLGLLSAEQANYKAALVYFSKAVDLDPHFAFAYHNRGRVYRRARAYELALKDFNQAIKINPRKAANYYQQGLVQLLVDRPEPALEDFNRAIDLYPYFSAAKIFRAIAYYQIGEIDSAQQYLKMSQQGSLTSEDSTLLLQFIEAGLLNDSLDFQYQNK